MKKSLPDASGRTRKGNNATMMATAVEILESTAGNLNALSTKDEVTSFFKYFTAKLKSKATFSWYIWTNIYGVLKWIIPYALKQ